jgi:hypothetical protein
MLGLDEGTVIEATDAPVGAASTTAPPKDGDP